MKRLGLGLLALAVLVAVSWAIGSVGHVVGELLELPAILAGAVLASVAAVVLAMAFLAGELVLIAIERPSDHPLLHRDDGPVPPRRPRVHGGP